MKENGSLLCLEFIKHPYPHCWRCKKPVIFRATEQWFISVDKDNLRGRALEQIGNTNWFPGWGENRIRGMVESRPDWCISRQRSWGVPIPAFSCKKCGRVHFTGAFNEAVRKLFAVEGSNAWFAREVSEILPPDLKCDCGANDFEKENDILDVWFESGASHFAVIKDNPQYSWPADLYLEGSDQHRGWFQTSLLTAVAAFGEAPYRAVLTHGFTVDAQGKKMSKSRGNVVNPQEVVKKYGADVLRLWVASADFRDDLAASDGILQQIADAYNKIRNTCRFLLSNLGDYAPRCEAHALLEIDRWILLRLAKLIARVKKAYDEFEFHVVYHSIYDFCVNDLSAFHLDLSKDRLYCDTKNSAARRSAQFAMREILLALIKLLAPVTPFLAEDLLRHVLRWPPRPAGGGPPVSSVLLFDFPSVPEAYLDKELEEKWERLLEIRAEVYRVLEIARQNKDIGGSTEARVEIYAGESTFNFLKSVYNMLSLVFICSNVVLQEDRQVPAEAVRGEKIKDLSIIVRRASGKKCVRCWNFRESVGVNVDFPDLCERCFAVVSGKK
jgi:isoleucyl-tRNA synthetase